MQNQSTLKSRGTVSAVSNNGSVQPYPLRLWQFGIPTGTPPFNTILLIHGRRADTPDRDESLDTIYPRLVALAAQLARQSAMQVLLLDWGEAATDDLPPYDAAGRIRAIATWAVAQLADTSNLTLIGHSLGSYVAAEIGRQRPVDRLIGLDPAFPAQNYDMDALESGDQSVTDFIEAATETLAFVVADGLFQLGLAGDNNQAGTAKTSFVTRLDGLGGVFDADEAHGAVIDLYADLSRYLQPGTPHFDALWESFERDRYDNSGDRDGGLHEGVAYADRVDVDDVWRIQWLDGDGTDLYFVSDAAAARPINDDGGDDTVLSLVDFSLDDSFEALILGGSASLDGSGNAADNELWGNEGENQLSGGLGNDTLHGDGGTDVLLGQAGTDRLWGNQEADTLMGGTGNDILRGGLGADVLWGDRGHDVLQGGAGADVFVLQDVRGKDTLEDFVLGFDVLGVAESSMVQRLTFQQRSDDTLIQVEDRPLALVIGLEASALSPDYFISVENLA